MVRQWLFDDGLLGLSFDGVGLEGGGQRMHG